jgi:hypothetical protein
MDTSVMARNARHTVAAVPSAHPECLDPGAPADQAGPVDRAAMAAGAGDGGSIELDLRCVFPSWSD